MTKYLVTPTPSGDIREEVVATFTHTDTGDVHIVYLSENYRGVRPVECANFTEMLRLGYQAWVVEEQVVDVLG
jgi:hypothetical protein